MVTPKMATIRVSRDSATIKDDQGVKFFLGWNKMDQKLKGDETVELQAPAEKYLEFKACFCGWLGEPTSAEQIYMAAGSSIHFEVFYDGKLRLREVSVPSDTHVEQTQPGTHGTIRAMTRDKLPSYGLWLDGKKHRQRLKRGEVLVTVTPGVRHTFRASSFPTKTHKTYLTFSSPGHKIDYQVWAGPRSIYIVRLVGYENKTFEEVERALSG